MSKPSRFVFEAIARQRSEAGRCPSCDVLDEPGAKHSLDCQRLKRKKYAFTPKGRANV